MSKVNEATIAAVNSLADILKPQLSVTLSDNKETAVVSLADKAYVNTLPEGITPEILKKIEEHNSIFFPAATKAYGTVTNEHFAQHKELKSTHASFELTDDKTLQLSMQREKQFRNPQGDESIVKHGYITAAIESREASTKHGVMKSVCDDLAEQAMKLLMS